MKTAEEWRLYHREWHAKQSIERKKYKSEIQKKRRHELRKWFDEYKNTLKCSICSESHISCLDFHHNDPLQKEISLCNAIGRGWSKKSIVNEVEKCSIVCSNCHRKLHWNEKSRTGCGLIGKPPTLEVGYRAGSNPVALT